MIDKFNKLFPLWAIIVAILALKFPAVFSGFKGSIIPLLMLVMFGMGMTLTWENFLKVFKMPGVIVYGILIQYLIMPLTAYLIATIFHLSAGLMAGVVLLGCSPGGTASNVMCYLGNADVALSVTLTTTNTLLAVIATPAFSYLFLSQIVPVPFWGMMLSILEIVILPVLIGTAINSFWGKKIDRIRNVFPLISTSAILVIIAIIVALNKKMIFNVDVLTVLSVFLLNAIGYAVGYYITGLFKYDKKIRRTVGIEVGMQNSGLSVALAIKYFSTLAALPGALFSVWQNISAPILAVYWKRTDRKLQKQQLEKL